MVYFISKGRENKSCYFCTGKKNLSFPATAVVENSTKMIIKKSGNHVHDSINIQILQRKVRQFEEKAIRKAADNHTAPGLSLATSPTPLAPYLTAMLAKVKV